MFKEIKKILFVFSLLFPIIVFAQEKSVSISCTKTSINVNESTTCTLVGYSDVDITNIDAMLSSDSSLNISNISASLGWTSFGERIDNHLELVYVEGVKNTFSIVTFDVKSQIKGSYKVYVKNTNLGDDNNTYNVNNSELVINVAEVKSANNTLKDIKISNTNFKYDSSKTDFSISVANTVKEVDVTAVKPDAGAIVTGEKKYTLNEGKNVISLYCKAENGSTKKYTITITRLAKSETQNSGESDKKESLEEKKDDSKANNTSSNNYLSKLEVKESQISFNKSLTSYNITVESNIDKLTLEYEVENEKSTVEVRGNENFKTGKNKVEIIVKSEDGNTKTYTINVTKKEEKIVLENDEDKILEAINNSENNSTIYVNVNESDSNKTVDKNIIDAINNKNKTVVYQVVNNNNILYTVTLDKNSISNLEKFDYSINFKSDKDEVIAKKINEKYLTLSFNNQERITNKIKYRINLENTNLKSSDNLFMYKLDNETNKLSIVKDKIKVDNNYVTLELNEFGEYILTNVDIDENLSNQTHTVENRNVLIILLIVILAISITVMIIISEKKKK